MNDLSKAFDLLSSAGRLPGQRKADGSWAYQPEEKCLRCGQTDGDLMRLTDGEILELIHPECAIAQLEGKPIGVRPSPLEED